MSLIDIEELCDREGNNVIESLVEMCHGKAEHVLSNWQDKQLAEYWLKTARQLSKITFPY